MLRCCAGHTGLCPLLKPSYARFERKPSGRNGLCWHLEDPV
jgi:hypothetical protein